MTEKFDGYLNSFNQSVHKRSPFSVAKPQTFQWSSTTLVPGKTITGQTVINATLVHGLNDMYRNNSLKGEKTGLHAWRASGQVVLAAPMITGSVYMSTKDATDNLTFPVMSFVSIADADTAFDFESTINEHWNQIVYTSFEYNRTGFEFSTFLNCSPQIIGLDCTNQQGYIRSMVMRVTVDIKFMIQNMLSSVPFN